MSLDEKIVSISSKFDYTLKTSFSHGFEFDYQMPIWEESALKLISRLEGFDFCHYMAFNNSHELFLKLNEFQLYDEIGKALELALMFNWEIDDKTYEYDICLVPFSIGNMDLYNNISYFFGGMDEQEITSLHYSFFINSFFEHFNKRKDSFKYNIEFSPLYRYKREALKKEDFELLDYLSQEKLFGFSPTRLIGNRKYWNL